MYGIYRERARSATLSVVMYDRGAAITQAEQLSSHGFGPCFVVDGNGNMPDTIKYNDPTALRYIARVGDWDSRSSWQPYPAPGAVIL